MNMKQCIIKEDLDSIASRDCICWDKLRSKTVAITGATGLIGKLTVLALLNANEKYGLNIKVLAFVRNIEKAKNMFQHCLGQRLEFVQQDVVDPVDDAIKADYLIHGASVTASKTMVEKPVETIWATVQGTKNMLEFARRNQMQGVVFLSSMEVYGVCGPEKTEIRESDLGYIDPLNVRSSYSEGKRLAECLCASYAKEYGVPVKIARLALTFGAGVDKGDVRVSAQFARSVLAQQDIVLHTKGDKANCYCYTSDAVAALLMLLTSGEPGHAYNVANQDTFCSIRELAETFIQARPDAKSQLVFDIPEDITTMGYAPSTILRLNSEKLMALGWNPEVGLLEMAGRLMDSLEEGT